MKLKCPACGAIIPENRINIQQMVAICPNCDNVFKFDGAFHQRRKIKAPMQFRVVDDDPAGLNMAFKWSWRTEPPVGLFGIAVGLSLALVMLIGMIGEGAPLIAMLIPLAPAAFLSYILLTLAVNSTHYETDGDMLNVYTSPLPFFRYGSKRIALDEIDHVSIERPAYAPFPDGKEGFYDVYVETFDGERLRIAAIVNYQHAHFIAQEIEAYLRLRQEIVTVSLNEDEPDESDAEITEQADEADTRKAAHS